MKYERRISSSTGQATRVWGKQAQEPRSMHLNAISLQTDPHPWGRFRFRCPLRCLYSKKAQAMPKPMSPAAGMAHRRAQAFRR